MNSPQVSGFLKLLRLLALLLGVIILFWLSFEDQSEYAVLLLSTAVCAWWAARFLVERPSGRTTVLIRHIIICTLAGLAIAPVAILLMAFKSGIHGHGSPDFTAWQIQSVLSRTPFLTVGGLLLGVGSALWRLAR